MMMHRSITKALSGRISFFSNVRHASGFAMEVKELEVSSSSEGVREKKTFLVDKAIEHCLAHAKGAQRKFDETLDIALQLGVDPRKPNQNVRGIVKLPKGTGKKIRVAVFARGAHAESAKSLGAHVVGAEDLIKSIQEGNLDFDRCIATPDMMPLIGRIAKILGPRGLMPNPKLGTVTRDVASALKDATGGQVEFRTEKKGVIHAGIGKVSFEEQDLLENFRAFMVAISDAKPEGAKGKYILKAHLSSTMGPSFPLDVQYIDPSSPRFMRFDAE